MKNAVNPFYYGNEVYAQDFCNRVVELDELHTDVTNGINVLLYAPRRFGKTSLLKKFKTQIEDDKTVVVFFDIFSVSSVDEFIQKYFHLMASSFESTSQKIIELFKDVLHIRPNISMDISNGSQIQYSLTFTKKQQDVTLEEVLNLPFLYAKKLNKKVVVIFDEFQEIQQLAIEKKLRSVIQKHGREVSYIFSGSKKSILFAMFEDKNRAFYKSVKHFHIGEIALHEWSVFAAKKFEKTGKIITDDFIKRIFDITEGFPYYTQQMFYFVWQMTNEKVTSQTVDQALELMYEREYDIYTFIWSDLTPNQKKTLKYIVYSGGENIYNADSLNEFSLTASTVKSTVDALIKKDICDRKSDRVYIVDPFMRYWIKRLG